jgi:hypothetical protein
VSEQWPAWMMGPRILAKTFRGLAHAAAEGVMLNLLDEQRHGGHGPLRPLS